VLLLFYSTKEKFAKISMKFFYRQIVLPFYEFGFIAQPPAIEFTRTDFKPIEYKRNGCEKGSLLAHRTLWI